MNSSKSRPENWDSTIRTNKQMDDRHREEFDLLSLHAGLDDFYTALVAVHL